MAEDQKNNGTDGAEQPEKTENCMLRTEALTVGYDGHAVVSDAKLTLRRGEILVLIGPNGAGKTTLLKSLIRQLKPLAGTVALKGASLWEIPQKDLAKELAVVLTDRVKTELLTCYDVVAAGRYPYTGRFGLLSGEDRECVRKAMELVRITELSDCDFSRISDGQKQRVMLARAICQEPELLILDEPTSFLDIRYQLEFLQIVRELVQEKQMTVLMSLHELHLASRIADRVACVRGNRIDRIGIPEEIFTTEYLAELYDTDPELLKAYRMVF